MQNFSPLASKMREDRELGCLRIAHLPASRSKSGRENPLSGRSFIIQLIILCEWIVSPQSHSLFTIKFIFKPCEFHP